MDKLPKHKRNAATLIIFRQGIANFLVSAKKWMRVKGETGRLIIFPNRQHTPYTPLSQKQAVSLRYPKTCKPLIELCELASCIYQPMYPRPGWMRF